ncbi:LAMI_0D04236g1_1 [Lachancea mirantina]|uniref:sphinganine-1-phosphate aldolase n=1 Tax=Lachancea mirantina TaxID=1230905 RepID=A0A1G4JA97_9SACH|nr:LAMI_0D04236g1_1 [Lachancea mirantina]
MNSIHSQLMYLQSYLGQMSPISEELISDLRTSIINYWHSASWFELARDYLFVLFCLRIIRRVWSNVYGYGLLTSLTFLIKAVAKKGFNALFGFAVFKSKVDERVQKTIADIETSLMKNDSTLTDFRSLPRIGLSNQDVLKELDLSKSVLKHSDWENGKVSGAVYHGGDDLIHLQSLAFEKYCVANQLHPDVFPAVRKMESEVVSMVLKMFNAPLDTGCGATTSGGTESLLLACLSAKVYAKRYRGVTEPEIIVPVTAHAGFDKAAYYFGIKLHHVELDPATYKVDIRAVKRLINRNTVLLVGSAPNFPHGIIDDIEALGKLAERYHIPLHVDCCLGSFVIAFMEKAGFSDVAPFDFRVPGVTSISCDTHKYGFAPKGSSVIMYRNRELRSCQYYLSTEWTGGLYASPTLAGSRPGALVVGCWATMVHLGEAGYTESCREIIQTARKLKTFIQDEVPELEILGNPQCSVVSFTSTEIDVYELSDKLSKKGWHLSALQRPPALHLAVTKLSISSAHELKQTLLETVRELKQLDSKPASDGTSALYGIAGSVQTTGIVDRLLVGFLDTLYKVDPDVQSN